MKLPLIKIVLLLCLPFNISCQNKELQSKELLKKYIETLNAHNGFTGEVLVTKNDKMIFHDVIGHNSIENKTKLKKNDVYRIASITKTFTSLLIFKAKEENKLKINDKISSYIGGLSQDFKSVTIQHLLSHTSGLPHNEGIENYWKVKSKLHLTPKEVFNEINQLKLLFQTGERFSYSSPGYVLLAIILEKIYNLPFQTILKQKVLNPLKMENTGIRNSLQIIPNFTSGYHLINDDSLVVAPYRNFSLLKGAGDMYSNVADLSRYINSYYDNSIISEQSKKEMFHIETNENYKNDEHYLNGWYVDDKGILKYYHGGGTWGYSSIICMYPKEKTSIIILSNVSTLPIKEFEKKIEDIVFSSTQDVPEVKKENKSVNITLDNYIGDYQSKTSSRALKVFKKGEKLYLQLQGNPPFQIYAKATHSFFGKKVNIDIDFKEKNGKTIGLLAKRQGQTFHFNKQ